jgi:hypothetical protein
LRRHSLWDSVSSGCHSHLNLIQVKLIGFACHCNLVGFGSPSPVRFLFTNVIGLSAKVGLAPPLGVCQTAVCLFEAIQRSSTLRLVDP